MKFLSICSGIEAASIAFAPLGWTASAFSEIEPFPNAVLAHHYPTVPNLGDMTQFRSWPDQVFIDSDLIVGGPPCQAFSVAGNRMGLDDARGNITLIYVELINHADAIRLAHGLAPVVVIYENVPGLLSDKTNAFGSFLGALSGEDEAVVASGKKWTNSGVVLGSQRTIAWRTLDAQHFGLAQRRKRVFVVASARDEFDPSAILFEFEGLRRDSAPSRETGQDVAGTIAARFGISRNNHEELAPVLQNVYETHPADSRIKEMGETCQTVTSRWGTGGGNIPLCLPTVIGNVEGGSAATLSSREYKGLSCGRDGMTSAAVVYEPLFAPIPIHDQATRFNGKHGEKQDGKGNGLGIGEPGAPMNTLTKGDRHAVAYEAIPLDLRNAGRDPEKHDAVNRQGVGVGECGDPAHTVTTAVVHGVAYEGEVTAHSLTASMAVRRLTPVECERLQGFPDGFTNIPWRKQPTSPDGPRYKALGNSWAVNVAAWVGKRIDDYLKETTEC